MNNLEKLSNKNLIKNESGILVEPDFLLANKKNIDIEQEKINAHNKARRFEIKAPVPPVSVPFSCVMTKAIRPKLFNTLEKMNLVNIGMEGDDKFQSESRFMNRKIYNEQEIVCLGNNAKENFSVGQLVKIDFRRFVTIRDTNESAPTGEYTANYDLPIHNINGHDYLMIDQRDILWAYNENHQLNDLIGFEDETI